MSWEYEKSSERIANHLASLGDIEVQKLVRSADLDSLLSEKECRDIVGAHVYVDVPNFAPLVSKCSSSEDETRRLVQAVHLYQREVARIVEQADLFDGVRVHFQGAKLHALFYRPIDDRTELGRRAVLLQLVLRDFTRTVFNRAFQKLAGFQVAAGADIGSAIGTRNGMRGDRELLFLGAPANYAAKIIGPAGTLRISEEVFNELPPTMAELCVLSPTTDYDGNTLFDVLDTTSEEVVQLCTDLQICWDPEQSLARLESDIRQFPLSSIEVGRADVLIDLDALGITNSKRVTAASLFADVAGFTRYVDRQTTEEAKERALRVFHVIRREMSRVIRHDFSGLRVQFQGDRVQGLFHMPPSDEGQIVNRAVEAAVGLQSSMIHTLARHLPEAQSLSLTIGIDVGTTLVTKLGTRGHRDRICIGEAVEGAASCEEGHCGGEIALTARAFKVLSAGLKCFFTVDDTTGEYIARTLTADKVERAQSLASFAAPAVHVRREGGSYTVSSEAVGGRAVQPGRSYAD
jgi:class 3 adenylate cyclase